LWCVRVRVCVCACVCVWLVWRQVVVTAAMHGSRQHGNRRAQPGDPHSACTCAPAGVRARQGKGVLCHHRLAGRRVRRHKHLRGCA
jgi:hypothetical protein